MQIVTLVGNRPQFIKAAAVSQPLRKRHSELLVNSGQHYDRELSDVFFEELPIPVADVALGIGSAPDGEQVARIMHSFAEVVSDAPPDLVLVYGDTNTTLAGALVASKLGYPLVHVEAGMRSFDRTMPEERNRVIADHVADLNLCSTETAMANLEAEAAQGESVLVGDVMADVSLAMLPVARDRSSVLDDLDLTPGSYLLVTAHRAGNVDDPARLEQLVLLLESLPEPAVLPLHPRTKARLEAAGMLERLRSSEDLHLTEPLGYVDFMALLVSARAVLTDSGGVQKEAYLASVPCITLRDTTEWVETIELGWNRLIDLDRVAALKALGERSVPAEHPQLYGGGRAGQAVVAALEKWQESHQQGPPA